jgi:hypothetical protein
VLVIPSSFQSMRPVPVTVPRALATTPSALRQGDRLKLAIEEDAGDGQVREAAA